MPLPGTPHVARMSILFTFGTDGQKCENTFYVRDASDAIFANPSVFAIAVLAEANVALRPALSRDVLLTGCGFEDVRTFPFGGLEIAQVGLAGTYSLHDVRIPSSVAFAVRKSTATLGRAGRGRWYWPVGDTSQLGATNDTVAPAAVSSYLTALQNFQVAVEAGFAGIEMGIVSYRSGNVQRSAGLFSRITAWGAADTNVDNQRRRLTGRGK